MPKKPAKRYPGEGHPWADYLHHRMRLLATWRDEGKTAEECVRDLRTDPGQIRLLWMTYDRNPGAYRTPNEGTTATKAAAADMVADMTGGDE